MAGAVKCDRCDKYVPRDEIDAVGPILVCFNCQAKASKEDHMPETCDVEFKPGELWSRCERSYGHGGKHHCTGPMGTTGWDFE